MPTIELDKPSPVTPAVTVDVLDILLSRRNAAVAEDSNVAKPDWNDVTDMTAFVVAVVAFPEIDD